MTTTVIQLAFFWVEYLFLGENLEHLASGLTQAEKFQRGKGNEANEDDELDPELMAQASFGGGTLEENGSKKRLSR
jgi:hypothetical protein